MTVLSQGETAAHLTPSHADVASNTRPVSGNTSLSEPLRSFSSVSIPSHVVSPPPVFLSDSPRASLTVADPALTTAQRLSSRFSSQDDFPHVSQTSTPLSPHTARPQPATRSSYTRAFLSAFASSSSISTFNGRSSNNGGSSSNGSAQSLRSIRSYRSTSSDSPLYMFKNALTSTKTLPFEETQLSDEDFEIFAKLAKDQQLLDAPGIWSKSITRTLYMVLVLAIIYLGLVGWPLWPGVIRLCWRFFHDGKLQKYFYGLISFILAGTFRNILPQFFCTFSHTESGGSLCSDPEKAAVGATATSRDASKCCIIIPCYKSAETLRSTLPACLSIFSPTQIFVVANGNSPTPLDHTEDVCKEFGVKHIWVPIGSKITAEFVGVALATDYKYCMLIDDDVLLPANLPLPIEEFGTPESPNKVACVGYTIKSVGAGSSRGTIIQQAQDIEYKLAGITKVFQSHYGSTTFPHGAVALWRRNVLEKIFYGHPGYHISEDWYLGHTARAAGYRIVMNSQVFVETETPPRLFPALPFSLVPGRTTAQESRGGYGEMSIFKQRFYRWNFFFLYRIWSNLAYLMFSWRLGWREPITKLWVFGEVFDSLIMLAAPIVLPSALAGSWRLTLLVSGGMLCFNFSLVCWFNLIHLGLLRRGRSSERIRWAVLPVYMFLKFVMVFINVASVYWSIYEYARFFTRQHLRVTESVPAWQVIRQNLKGTSRAGEEIVDQSTTVVEAAQRE